MKLSGKILLFIFILSGVSASRGWATVYPSDGTAASVQSIHDNSAHDGDTITLPAGAFTWTTGVNITKAITLQGQGVGVTIVKDDVNGPPFLSWDLRGISNAQGRMTGIEFQDGGRSTTAVGPSGAFHVDALNNNGTTFRMDHCTWNNINGLACFDTVIGVIDHNTFNVARMNGAIDAYATYWDGDTGGFGDVSWNAPTDFGSSQFLFIEDNSFSNSPNTSLGGVTDAVAGARFVVRYNSIYNMNVNNHGTDSTGRTRSCRAIEVYNNTYAGSGLNKFVGGTRGGLVLFHDNTISGFWDGLTCFDVENFRTFESFDTFGGADGTNPWDVNTGPYFTGTAASDSSNKTVTVSGQNWSTDYWRGYVLRRTSDLCNSGTLWFGEILSNTANTITYTGNGGYQPPEPASMTFCTGDTLEIRRVEQVMDGTGRALGALVTGGLSPTPPPGWNNQVSEGDYSWNNHSETHDVNFTTGTATIKVGEHIFNDTAMPGYTPYVYPHPLVSGSPTPTPTPTPGDGPAARAAVADFNGDGHPDYVLQNANTRQTAIWYLNNNVYVGGAYGPTLAPGWGLRAVADFNLDSHPDYGLFNSVTEQIGLWYLSGPTLIGSAWGPTLPNGWELVATADFNGDNQPDYVLYNGATRQTAVWYLNNNVYVGGAYGPILPPGWNVVGAADFDGDGHPDYLLFHRSSGYTAIEYLSGSTVVGAAWGPTVPSGWALVATADFNGNGYPDYVLYNAGTRETAIWYLNNNVYVSGAYGPTLPAGWSLIAQ